jgi:DNA repair protein RAD5
MSANEDRETPQDDLFFAGSSDEEEDVEMQAAHDNSSSPGQSHGSRASSPLSLFIPDSDDEIDNEQAIEESNEKPRPKRKIIDLEEEEFRLVSPEPVHSKPRSGIDSAGETSFKEDSSVPSSLKQKIPTPVPPSKKPRTNPPSSSVDSFPPTYLGEILVPNAWSNISGKGYIKNGDRITLHRDEENSLNPVKGSKDVSTKGTKKGDGKKQVSITSMLKPRPIKNNEKKKKSDTIVSLLNSRGNGAFHQK